MNVLMQTSLQKTIRMWQMFLSAMLAPLSPRNLRLSAFLIAIYQMLVAHVMLFVVLLGLAHAEQMKTMLAFDIDDQKEFGLYDSRPFPNHQRLKSASQLLLITEELLYMLTTCIVVYLLSTLCLVGGVYKNRTEFILPWIVVEFVFITLTLVLLFWLQDQRFVAIIGGKANYFFFGVTILMFESLMWYTIYSFYQSLRTMNKLTEIATVAVPCPAPGSIPSRFRKENMYVGSNGYKHILTESPDGFY